MLITPTEKSVGVSDFCYCSDLPGIVDTELLDKLEFVELINADSLFLHKPHTPNYRKGS